MEKTDHPAATAADDSAVYFANDITRLYRCGINQINDLVKKQVIPAPLGKLGRNGRKRWSKAAVHRDLGYIPPERNNPPVSAEDICKIVDARMAELLRDRCDA